MTRNRALLAIGGAVCVLALYANRNVFVRSTLEDEASARDELIKASARLYDGDRLVDLSRCGLGVRELLPLLCQLSNVEVLVMPPVPLHMDDLPSCRTIDGLKEIRCHNIKVQVDCLAALKGQGNLKHIAMTKCAIEQKAFNSLSAIPSLRSINLNLSNVDEDAFADLARCKGLTAIYLDHSNVTDTTLQQLNVPSLRVFSVRFTSVGPRGLFHLVTAHNLVELYASGTVLDDRALKAIALSPTLRTLDLRMVSLSPPQLDLLLESQSLEWLGVSAAPELNESFRRILSMKALKTLSIHDPSGVVDPSFVEEAILHSSVVVLVSGKEG